MTASCVDAAATLVQPSIPSVSPASVNCTHGVATGTPSRRALRCREWKSLQLYSVLWMPTLQVAEVRETQPDCRLYIAITKCDQLEEMPTVAEQDTGQQDSSNSSNGGAGSGSDCLAVEHIATPDAHHVPVLSSHGPA